MSPTGAAYVDVIQNVAQNADAVALFSEKRSTYTHRFIAHVDLSAKLEQWSKDSAIAVSNGECRALWVSKEIKQQARQLLMARYGRLTVRYRLLAVLVFLLVRDDLHRIECIYIDRDYAGAGAEAAIKNVLLHLLRQDGRQCNAGFVRFTSVKGSLADETARRIYAGKELRPRSVGWDEVNAQIQKLGKATAGHKRRIA